VRGPAADSDLALVQQLKRVAGDVQIATSAAAASVTSLVVKARAHGGFHALITSPALGEDDTARLVGALRKSGEPLAVLPVVTSAHRGLGIVAAGADTPLLLADGELTNLDEILRSVERRTRLPYRFLQVRDYLPAAATTAWRRAMVEMRTLQDRIGALQDRIARLQEHVTRLQDRIAGPKSVEPLAVHVVRRVDEELIEAAARLVPQLQSSATAPGHWELEQIVRHSDTTLLIVREGHAIVGMLMLAVFRGPTGPRAWIEDLVVDEPARGRGAGTLLTQEALRIAAERGAHTAQLSCQPSRLGPNRVYQRLGFKRREANLYRYRMSS
jgi:ribosomal protein S18 acetylase RimI-like enzyme